MKKYHWKISLKESSIQIKARYMGIGLVLVSFLKFKGEVLTESHFKNPGILIRIDTRSVSTLDEQLDEQIRSTTWLDTINYPDLLFTARDGCRDSPGGISELSGYLSIRGIEKPITLVVNFSDIRDSIEPQSASFNLFGRISLRELGIPEDIQKILEDDLQLNATIGLRLIP